MQFVKEFPPFDPELLDKINELVLNDSSEFSPSHLYKIGDETITVDSTKRKSKFKLLKSRELFELMDKYIQLINQQDSQMEFQLVKNDITCIRYSKGDFFEAHQDFLSYTSNIIEEYTMVLSLDSDCNGGHTIIHVNDHFKHFSRASKTKYHSLIFRKDMKHEGEILKSGQKCILTMNLLAMDKKAKQIVLVKFPKENKVSYFIDLEKILKFPNNKISKTFKNQKTKFLIYHETKISKEKFNVVYKLLIGYSLSKQEINENTKLFQYYGFNIRNILTNSLVEEFQSKIQITQMPPKNPTNQDNNLVLYTNDTEFEYNLKLVKEKQLPMMPFTTYWLEGKIGINEYGQIHEREFNMEPVLITFSENNNVYSFYDLNISNAKYEKSGTQYRDNFIKNKQKFIETYFPYLEYKKETDYFNYQYIKHAFFKNRLHDPLIEKIRDYIDHEEDEDLDGSFYNCSGGFQGYTFLSKRGFNLSSLDDYKTIHDHFNEDDGLGGYEVNPRFIEIENQVNNINMSLYLKLEDQFSIKEFMNRERYLFTDSMFCFQTPLRNPYSGVLKFMESGYYLDPDNEDPYPMEYYEGYLDEDRDNEFSRIENEIKKKNEIEKKTKILKHYAIQDNILVLDDHHIPPLLDRIGKVKFTKTIRQHIPKLPFEVVQQMGIDKTLCNETAYGNLRLLKINGFLKMV